MDDRSRTLLVGAATVGLFLLVQVGALVVIEPFLAAGLQPVENPSDPTNSLLYFVGILGATALMLLAIRLELSWAIRGFVLLGTVLLSWYVLAVFLPLVVAVAGGLLIGAGLVVHPEWYVIDVAGVVMGAGAAGLFGITFGILPALVLLSALAVYDAVSVYGTEHMLALAEGAMEMRIPVLFVIPTTLSYSFVEATTPPSERNGRGSDGEGDGEHDGEAGGVEGIPGGDAASPAAEGSPGGGAPEETETVPAGPLAQDALFIGLGDAVVPTVMVTSAVSFADAPTLAAPLVVNLPALAAWVGTLLGLVVLLWMVFGGRPHAGLPLLNGGAIAGYLVGAVYAGIPLVEALGLGPYL